MERQQIKTACRGNGFTKIMPPQFDGKATSWSVFRKQFEAAVIANMWNAEEKATASIVALRSDALDSLQAIPVEDLSDYNILVSRLEMRCTCSRFTRLN